MSQSAVILDELFADIQSKAGTDISKSYTASLLADGVEKPIRKLSEEVTETLIEVMKGDRQAVATESADLLYHLLVVWQAAGIDAEDVWQILQERRGISGHDEKANRQPS